MENNDLFGVPQTQPLRKKPVKWCLSTNQLNLMYMLSAGLIMSPKGFGKKYYADVLNIFPGWIPLFADAIPKEVINISTIEANHLKPCALIINLASLRGRVLAISRDGSAREVEFPDGLDGMEAGLLLPAPLPTSWIETIAFRSKEDKQACERDAQDYANVPVSEFKRVVDLRLLAGSNTVSWPLIGCVPSYRDESPDVALAAGGMMAMLFEFANIGDEAVKACRLAFDGEEAIATSIADPLIRGLYDWREKGGAPTAGDILPRLFWGAIDKVAASRSANDFHNPLDTAFSFLDIVKSSMDEKLKAALTKLSDDLRAISGYAESNITEIFERHTKLFPRVMALFFLRQKSVELLEFRHPLLSENDYVASALLFAARDGWLGLPLNARNQSGLSGAVSHRMAAMAHRLSCTGIDFGPPPPRCIPLRELFAPGVRGWSLKQKEAALILARHNKWDFIHTRISLGKGDYQLIINGCGTHILLPGEVKAVATEVDIKQFFKKLPEAQVPGKIDKKIREMLS